MTEDTSFRERLCRFCMHEENCSGDSNKVLNVFENGSEGINEKIKQCTRLDLAPEDVIPPNICKNCMDSVEQFSEFFEKCHKTDTFLRTIFNVNSTTSQTSQGSINRLSNEDTTESSSTIPKKIDQYDINKGASYSKAKDTNSLDDFGDESDSDSSSSLNATKDTQNLSIDRAKKYVNNLKLSSSDTNMYRPIEKNVEIFQMDESMLNDIGGSFNSYHEYFKDQVKSFHKDESEFSCPKCNKVISERKKLSRPDRKVLPKRYKCPACGSRQQASKATPQTHNSKPNHPRINICPVCGNKILPTKRNTTYHCKYCSFTTKSIVILNAHTTKKHQMKTYKCEACAKWFKSELNLTQHTKRMHHSQKYICVMCGRAFAEKNDLKKHIVENHTSEKAFDCRICGREFFSARQLKEHLCTHREGCSKCPNCDKEFFYKKYLERHMLRCVPGLRERSFKAVAWNMSTVSLPNSSLR